MNRTLVAAGVVVLVVLAALLAVVSGVVPLGGNSEDVEDFPTQTGTASGGDGDSGDGDGGDGGSAATTEAPPFEMIIEEIESCGQTCRDVTGRLVNNQEREATGVTVYTRIYAGDDTEGDVVWEGSQDIGQMGPGEAERDTQRVELGMSEAAAVQSNDGEITILTIIETDRQTVSFTEHRDVS